MSEGMVFAILIVLGMMLGATITVVVYDASFHRNPGAWERGMHRLRLEKELRDLWKQRPTPAAQHDQER